jgi:predicted nuclease with TOPRIM domain
MSTEQRLDRLERIVLMFARSGARSRREMNEKINILIDAQIKNEDRVAKLDERFAKFDERCAKYDALFAMHNERFAKFDERFAKFDERFKELGERTDETLRILMALVKDKHNGSSENRPSSKH